MTYFLGWRFRRRKLEMLIMATFEQVKEMFAANNTALEELNAKTDTIIAKLQELQAGGGATPEQLDELLILAVDAKEKIEGQHIDNDMVLQRED